MRTQTELKARAVIAAGLNTYGPAQLPTDVYRIGLILDRNAWPADAQIRIAVEYAPTVAGPYLEILSDSPAPGVYVNRFGQVVATYTLERSAHKPLLAGGFVRARVESNRAFDTRIQIVLDDTPPPAMLRTNSVTYDDSVSAQATATAGPLSVSLTIANNSDRGLIITAGMSAGAPGTFTAWGWGADTVNEEYDALAQTNYRVGVASLIAPAAATRNATATISASADEAMITATSVYNASQSDLLGTIQSANAASSAAWVACDGVTDGMSFGFAYGLGTAVADVDGVPEYIAVGTAVQSAGATTLTPTAAAGALRGDLDFCSIATENNNAISCSSSGWAKVGSTVQQDATWQEEIWMRVHNGTNVDPVFTWTGSVGCSARRWLMRDVKQTATPIGNHQTNSGTGATHSLTGQNSTANDSTHMYLSHAEANTALAADADYVEKFDAGSNTGPYRLVVGTRDQITSGAGSAAFSATGANASWIMRLLEILAAGDQTLREEQENIATVVSGALATEPGATYNTFGWTFTTGGNWHAVAFSVNPAAAADQADFSASGTGAMTMAGASEASGAMSMSGSGSMTMVGASLHEAAVSMSGQGEAQFEGAALAAGDVQISGQGDAQFNGSSEASGAVGMDGVGDAQFVGASEAAGEGSGAFLMSGSSDVNFEGASEARAEISIDGQGEAQFEGAAEARGDLSIDGQGEASFEGEATGAAVEEEEPEAHVPPGDGGAWPRPNYYRRKRLKREDEELEALIRAMAPHLMQHRRVVH